MSDARGKSTIVEALRLVSLIANRLEGLAEREVPRWLDIGRVNRGVSPSLSNQDLNFGNVFHKYGDPPAKITAKFSGAASCPKRFTTEYGHIKSASQEAGPK